jgi:hypothetical protein
MGESHTEQRWPGVGGDLRAFDVVTFESAVLGGAGQPSAASAGKRAEPRQ